MYNELGAHWSKIALHFPNRTENSIKNRFYSSLRRVSTENRRRKHRQQILSNEIQVQGLDCQALDYIPALHYPEQIDQNLLKLQENAIEQVQKKKKVQQEENQKSFIHLISKQQQFYEQLSQLQYHLMLTKNQNNLSQRVHVPEVDKQQLQLLDQQCENTLPSVEKLVDEQMQLTQQMCMEQQVENEQQYPSELLDNSAVVNQLEQYSGSRGESGEKTETDLNQLLNQVQQLEELLGKTRNQLVKLESKKEDL